MAVRAELSALHRRLGFTGTYVTHDQSEGFHLAQHVMIPDHGRVVQSGPPEEVYRAPATEQVARIPGANVIHGTIGCPDAGDGTSPVLATNFSNFPVASGTPPGPAVAALYPPAVRLVAPAGATAEVTAVGFIGGGYEVVVQAGSDRITLLDPSRTPLQIGAPVQLTADADVNVLNRASARRAQLHSPR